MKQDKLQAFLEKETSIKDEIFDTPSRTNGKPTTEPVVEEEVIEEVHNEEAVLEETVRVEEDLETVKPEETVEEEIEHNPVLGRFKYVPREEFENFMEETEEAIKNHLGGKNMERNSTIIDAITRPGFVSYEILLTAEEIMSKLSNRMEGLSVKNIPTDWRQFQATYIKDAEIVQDPGRINRIMKGYYPSEYMTQPGKMVKNLFAVEVRTDALGEFSRGDVKSLFGDAVNYKNNAAISKFAKKYPEIFGADKENFFASFTKPVEGITYIYCNTLSSILYVLGLTPEILIQNKLKIAIVDTTVVDEVNRNNPNMFVNAQNLYEIRISKNL